MGTLNVLTGMLFFGGVILSILMVIQQLNDDLRNRSAMVSIILLILGMFASLAAILLVFTINKELMNWLFFVSATLIGASFCISIIGHLNMIKEKKVKFTNREIFIKFYSGMLIVAGASYTLGVLATRNYLLAAATGIGFLAGIFGFIKIPWIHREDNSE